MTRIVTYIYFVLLSISEVYYQAIAKVKRALIGNKGSRLADLEMMVNFTHTGELGTLSSF